MAENLSATLDLSSMSRPPGVEIREPATEKRAISLDDTTFDGTSYADVIAGVEATRLASSDRSELHSALRQLAQLR